MPSSSIPDPIKIGFLWCIAIVLVGVVIAVDPIAQDPAYHCFADDHTFLGIPNFCNVLSNLPFVLVAIWAFFWKNKLTVLTSMRKAYQIFFVGIFTVGFGSAYYHWLPNNATLLWDRLPMTIAFMAFFSLVIAEFVDEKFGRRSVIPFLLIGSFSAFYWYFTEQQGVGDLRFYALVQFLPIIMMPLIFIFFKSKFTHAQHMWWILLAYGIAKLLEHFDHQVHDIIGFVGGHPLKHIAAAVGPLIFLFILRKRKAVEELQED